MKFRQLVWVMVIVAVGATVWFRQNQHSKPILHSVSAGTVVEENHYSPTENLEQLDLAQIDGAKKSLDIAMFAFTDKYLAEGIVRAAQRGVNVRIYRDHQQFEDEQRRASQHKDQSSSAMCRGERNIQVRVKRKHELMHLKAYCVDGALLRDGSANWSPSGLKRQDNNARFTTDPVQVKAFQRAFDEMWNQRENDEF